MRLLAQKIWLIAALLLLQPLTAQTVQQAQQITKDYNKTKLSNLKQEYFQKFKINKENALAYAVANNIPVIKEENGSSYKILQKILADGTLIYYQTHNMDAGHATRTDHLHIGGSTGLDLMGSGMTAHIWDAGIARITHQEYRNSEGESRYSVGDDSDEMHPHAGHVTGTIIATGLRPQAKGMAPQSLAIGYDWNFDLSEVTQAAAEGMLVSNHSYGWSIENLPSDMIGAYLEDARDVDEIMFNAPYYLMVNSAGNDGGVYWLNEDPLEGMPEYDLLTAYATAKNNLIVALAYDVEIDEDGNFLGADISYTSSKGPTDDYRIKPDLAGYGSLVYSTTTNSNNSYDTMSGTTIAAPNISGSLLLLQEYYNRAEGQFMKAATLKGLALHTADDMESEGPDAKSGWGMMNAKRAAETISGNGQHSLIKELTLTDGEEYILEVTSDGVNDLWVSISWTDPAGEIIGGLNNNTPALVNDLDVRVYKDNEIFMPWKLTGVLTNAKGDNVTDPFEKIEIPNAEGTYQIIISHKNQLTNGSQDYSLIISGIDMDAENCNPVMPTGLTVNEVEATWAEIISSDIPVAKHEYRYRKTGSNDWVHIIQDDRILMLNNLDLSTEYEVQVSAHCPDGENSPYSESVYFTTKDGCPQGNKRNPDLNQDENRLNITMGNPNNSADDFFVPEGETHTFKTIVLNLRPMGTIETIKLNFYDDNGNGKPGQLRSETFTFTPTLSHKILIDPGVFQVYLDIDLTLEGGHYWIQPEASGSGKIYWEATDKGHLGRHAVKRNNNTAWTVVEDIHGVFMLYCDQFDPPVPNCNYWVTQFIEPISRVMTDDFDNYSNPEISPDNVDLEDFTDLIKHSFAGDTFEITMEGNTDGPWPSKFSAFIDWSQGFWTEYTHYPLGTITNSNGQDGVQLVSSITIPDWVQAGDYVLRIIKAESVAPLTNPCMAYNYGQAEDYTIRIAPAPEDSCDWIVRVWQDNFSGDEVSWELRKDDEVLLSGGNYGYHYEDIQMVSAAGLLEFYITSIGENNNNNPSYEVSNDNGVLIHGTLPGGAEETYTALGCEDDDVGAYYCRPVMECTNNDMITNVSFGGINHDSGCSELGYSDFSDIAANAWQGDDFPISVTVGDGFAHESVSVWIDFNNNGDFEEDEYHYIGTGSGENIIGSIHIPDDLADGEYRMRVRVAAVPESEATSDKSCDSTQGLGETEDYMLNIDSRMKTKEWNQFDFTYYPNPVEDVLNIRSSQKIEKVEVFNLNGQKVMKDFKKLDISNELDVSVLNPGIYIFKVYTENGRREAFKIIKK